MSCPGGPCWVACHLYAILPWKVVFACALYSFGSMNAGISRVIYFVWIPEIESYLLWWSNARHLLAGVSLVSPQPDLLLGAESTRPVCLGVTGR